MAKIIKIKVEDNVYSIFRNAAKGQRRTLSKYMEYATLQYIMNETVVSDEEMKEILLNESALKKGLRDVAEGRYKIIV
ncbi:MAG: CopG family transcriptional regulator [Treponema sp.]|nr:CopG family transcriptional regulator [Treponema sp.]